MQLGIILNGVTGRMGTNQHYLRSILAIMQQGGVKIRDGRDDHARADPGRAQRSPSSRNWPRSVTGVRYTTDLGSALADPHNVIYFDAQTTGRRFDGVREAIAAGKHVYCEKPTATTTAQAYELYTPGPGRRREARRRAGQALAARPRETQDADRPGLLRRNPQRARRVRLLGFRRRHRQAAAAVVELPQGRRRRHHRRYALPLALRAR